MWEGVTLPLPPWTLLSPFQEASNYLFYSHMIEWYFLFLFSHFLVFLCRCLSQAYLYRLCIQRKGFMMKPGNRFKQNISLYFLAIIIILVYSIHIYTIRIGLEPSSSSLLYILQMEDNKTNISPQNRPKMFPKVL